MKNGTPSDRCQAGRAHRRGNTEKHKVSFCVTPCRCVLCPPGLTLIAQGLTNFTLSVDDVNFR